MTPHPAGECLRQAARAAELALPSPTPCPACQEVARQIAEEDARLGRHLARLGVLA